MATICSEQVNVVTGERASDRPVNKSQKRSLFSSFWLPPLQRLEHDSQAHPRPESRQASMPQLQTQPLEKSRSRTVTQLRFEKSLQVGQCSPDTGLSRATSTSTVSGLRRLADRARRWLARRQDLRDSRDAFAYLLTLDDALLDDIGVTRAEVENAASLPLAEDAAQSLHDATHGVKTCRI